MEGEGRREREGRRWKGKVGEGERGEEMEGEGRRERAGRRESFKLLWKCLHRHVQKCDSSSRRS